MAVALSKDKRTLAIDLLGHLWILPAEGGQARRITDESSEVRQPVWFPDGKAIAFQTYRYGSWGIASVAPDGANWKQLTYGPFDDREPDISPDGRFVAFSSDRSGNYDIWTLDLQTGQLRQWTTHPANESMPAWSPDGRRLAYVSDRASDSSPQRPSGQGPMSVRSVDRWRRVAPSPSVWTSTLEGQEKRVFLSEQCLDVPFSINSGEYPSCLNAPSWNPDGQRIVYNVVNGNGSQLMLAGKPLTTGEDVFPFRVQWLSSEEYLYTADGKIKRRSLKTGSDARTVEFLASLSFIRETYRRKDRDFDSEAVRPVRGIMKPGISPDGNRVAFVALGDLWLMSLNGRPRRITRDRYVEMDPAWSPGGSELVYSSDRLGTMDLWVYDTKTEEQRRLTELPSVERAAAWSPDQSKIAFMNEKNELHTVEVATGKVEQISDGLSSGYPSWSPDGRVIALAARKSYSSRFREGTSQILTLSLDDDSIAYFAPIPHRSIGARGWANGPLWSPDGTMMAYVMEGTLWVSLVNRKGEPIGAPRRLTNELADSPSWTGDSRHILYQSIDRLRMVSMEDGRAVDVPLELTWKPQIPDGRLVVHAGQLFDGRNPGLQPDVDILIEGNRIRSVQRHRADLHRGNLIDASGQFVIPGLIEMHTHHRKMDGEAVGRLWLSYGITTVQMPGGNPYEFLEDRESFSSGVRPGPRVFFTGNSFDGLRGSLGLEPGPQLEMQLERARILDYDLIKTYVRLPDLLQKRVVEYAHRYGMAVSSHELYPAVVYGADHVAHLGATSRRGYSPKLSALNHSYQDVIDLVVQSGISVTSTLGVDGLPVMVAHDRTILDDPRFVNLSPPRTVETTRNWIAHTRGDDPVRERLVKAASQTLVRIARAGGRLVAGTDTPIVPYGLGLHAELYNYVYYGLSPVQALQSATSVAAEALGAGQDLGTLEAGKLADLVIVEGNPLADIRNARRVSRVIKNGQVFELEALLQEQ